MNDFLEPYISFFKSIAGDINATYPDREKQFEFPEKYWNQMGSMAIHAGTLPNDAGGKNLSWVEYGKVLQQMGNIIEDNGLNFSIMAHTLACLIPLHKYSQNNEVKNLLPQFSNGKLILCNAITEVQGGSDVNNMLTTATKITNGFLLKGNKSFCSNAPVAHYAIVYAITDPTKGFFGGITAFLVNLEKKGITKEPAFEKLGLKTVTVCGINFNNVELTNADVVGQIGSGGIIFQESMVFEKSFMAACHVGTLQRWLSQMITFSKKRIVHGQPLVKQQVIAHMLADVKIKLNASTALVEKNIENLSGKNISKKIESAAIVKYFVSTTMTETAQKFMNLFAGEGYKAGSIPEIQLRDFMGSTSYSGTNDIQKNIIATNF